MVVRRVAATSISRYRLACGVNELRAILLGIWFVYFDCGASWRQLKPSSHDQNLLVLFLLWQRWNHLPHENRVVDCLAYLPNGYR